MEYLGFESSVSVFVKEQIDLHGLLSLREVDLNKLIPDVNIVSKIIEQIDHYARFSSVEGISTSPHRVCFFFFFFPLILFEMKKHLGGCKQMGSRNTPFISLATISLFMLFHS